MGRRRVRQVSALTGLLGAAALSLPAAAGAGGNPTTTSVNCVPGDRVVGSIPTTCSATVTDTTGGSAPTAVGTGTHMLTAAYPANATHGASSGFFNLIVTAPPSGGGGSATPAPTPTPPKKKKCKKGKRGKKGCKKKR